MGYIDSQLDRDNSQWFAHDVTRATLLTIWVRRGAIRGLRDVRLDFSYPITAIAGRNCSGKSTILALAACAYHGDLSVYHQMGRKLPYFTFSDFFIQAPGEVSPEGIEIWYQFLHNKWAITRHNKDKEGPGWQPRKKKVNGRWSNYDRRVHRPVAFLGINRIVPQAEKSGSRTSLRKFQLCPLLGIEENVRLLVGRVLQHQYESLEFSQHRMNRLARVRSGGRGGKVGPPDLLSRG